MSNPFNVIRPWNPGDTREVPERILKQARLEGRYDSYSRVYEMDSRRWKVQSQVNRASGEIVYTLVCVNE
jgi:hypothetical protein